MTEPETVLLQAQQAQLLLYSMGYRRVYGFLPEDPPDRQRSLQLFADLVRKEILQEQRGSLVLQSPWRDCLRGWGEADAVLRLHTADTTIPDCCCYPWNTVPGTEHRPDVWPRCSAPCTGSCLFSGSSRFFRCLTGKRNCSAACRTGSAQKRRKKHDTCGSVCTHAQPGV